LTAASDSTRPEDGVGGYDPKMTRWALVQAVAIDVARPSAAGDRGGDSNGEQLGDDGNFNFGNRGPGTGYGGATAAQRMLGGGWRRWLIDEVGAEEGRGVKRIGEKRDVDVEKNLSGEKYLKTGSGNIVASRCS
jgi:hypothetical protein